MLENKWVQRDKSRNSNEKEEIISRIATALLEREIKSLEGLRGYLARSAVEANHITDEQIVINAFNEAHEKKEITALGDLFRHLLYVDLLIVTDFEQIVLPERLKLKRGDVDSEKVDITTCNEYVQQSGSSVVVAMMGPVTEQVMSAPNLDASRPFSIHSVGKVFTGILMLKMLQNGLIPPSALRTAPQLDEKVLRKMPPLVREKLEHCTVLDLMLHQSGIGNYLEKYMERLTQEVTLAKNNNVPIKTPAMDSLEDFIPFFEDKIYDLDGKNSVSGESEHYSNSGILLVGFMIEHAYNSQPDTVQLSYNQILQKFILEPAGITSFATHNPGNGITNPTDAVAPHIVGSPAGGYWLTAEDLGKFGQWIIEQTKDKTFMDLLKEYGKEFYNPNSNTVAHSGGIPSSSMQLTCYLTTGTVIAIGSDKSSEASIFNYMLETHLNLDKEAKNESYPNTPNTQNTPTKRSQPLLTSPSMRQRDLNVHYAEQTDEKKGEKEPENTPAKPPKTFNTNIPKLKQE